MTTSSTEQDRGWAPGGDRLDRIGVPPRHQDATFGNWRERPGTEQARKTAESWVTDGGGLVLIGPPGTGKTHLVVAALHARLEAAGTRPIVGDDPGPLLRWQLRTHAHYEVVPLLLDRLRAAARTSGAEAEARFAHYRDVCQLLVLDDLGREKVTDWVAERLYVLVESRYGRKLPTVVTTNLSLDELAANGYGALVSRLTETCRFAKTTARDYRPEKGRQDRGNGPDAKDQPTQPEKAAKEARGQ